MSTHTTTPATAAVSPKVKAGAWVGLALLVLQAVLAEVTPDHFAWAGDYSAIFYAAVTGVGVTLAAYLKTDPLRNLGGAVADMGGTTPSVMAPEVDPPLSFTDPVVSDEDDDDDDDVTAEADALAARAAQLRRTGSTAGGAL